jgi:DNA-binding transcriptional regulator YiaG
MDAMKRTKRRSVGERIERALEELYRGLRSGKPLEEVFTVRTIEIPDPTPYDAKAVRRIRHRLVVSQAVFAHLLGVSVQLVEHWEQGIRKPQPMACRLLEEINRDATEFFRRHARLRAA